MKMREGHRLPRVEGGDHEVVERENESEQGSRDEARRKEGKA